MQIDLSKVSYDGEWFDFGESRLEIRPYPMSRQDVSIKDGAMVFTGVKAQDMFVYCLTGWENVKGNDDQPIKLTTDIKQKIYDFRLGKIKNEKGEEVCLSDFVLMKAREKTAGLEADQKN